MGVRNGYGLHYNKKFPTAQGVRQISGFYALAGFARMPTNRLKAEIRTHPSFSQKRDTHSTAQDTKKSASCATRIFSERRKYFSATAPKVRSDAARGRDARARLWASVLLRACDTAKSFGAWYPPTRGSRDTRASELRFPRTPYVPIRRQDIPTSAL